MKKLFLSLIVLAIGTMGSYAQDELVATLSHGSSLSTFIGADAFTEAYEAAVEGDVITLSPGVFNVCTIEKAITIRGAGMKPMESNGYVSTQLADNLTVNVPSETTSVLTLEGVQALGYVYFNGNNLAPVNVLKCRFEHFVTGFGISMNAYSCIFANGLFASYYNYYYQSTTLNCMNCVIVEARTEGYTIINGTGYIAKIIATNCLVNTSTSGIGYSVLTNCIITSVEGYFGDYPLPSSCTAQNCIGINAVETPDLFMNIPDPSNVMIEGVREEAFASVFKTLKVLMKEPNINETYELTAEAAAKYLGDDGKQVGIYGGTNPYNPTPTNPQIKKFSVSSTTEGEQLKVRINVQ